MKTEVMGFLLWLDRCVNVLLGGAFSETLSSRAHRMRARGHPYWGWTANAIDKLFFWEPDHCKNQWEREFAHGLPKWVPGIRTLVVAAVVTVFVVF